MATPSKKAFLTQAPPPGYIAGLGRSATGFTTRSDIGPARSQAAIAAQEQQQQQQTSSQEPHDIATLQQVVPEKDDAEYNDAQFDEWSGFGNERGLFSSGTYEADDEEADKVWEDVEQRMDERRRRRREEKERELLELYREHRPKISAQFADAKRKLAEVSESEWSSIPDIGDYTIKKSRYNRYTPVPDTLLERAAQESSKYVTYDPSTGTSSVDGTLSGVNTDLRAVSIVRESLVKNQLQQVEDSVSGRSTVDPKNYMSGLKSMAILGEAEIGDLKKARMLLNSATASNPSNSSVWIARARVEELAGKLSTARNIINQGCEAAGDSEDVWLEAARLSTPSNAKLILAKAAQKVPHSVNIWLAAAKLENTVKAKKKVIRRALEFIPKSVVLWKKAVELEEDENDAKVLLDRAVQLIPEKVDLWLALARMESLVEARKVLNRARKTLPTEPLIWISAAQLEEANNSKDSIIEQILTKAIKSLQGHHVTIKREDWIKYAYQSEEAEYFVTCGTIIRLTIGVGIKEHDQEHTWLKDAQNAMEPDPDTKLCHIETARAIYAHAISVFPKKRELWRKAAELEKQHGSTKSLLELLDKAVTIVPEAEELWLMAAKERWKAGDIDAARETLKYAFVANGDSEEIWLTAVKLEIQGNETERARKLLNRARIQANTARVWMKSAVFERNLGNREEERKILDESLKHFTKFDKLYLMRAQWEEAHGNDNLAREIYANGIKQCPNSVPLWKSASNLEERLGNITKARAILEKARLKNQKNDKLWLYSSRIESRAAVAAHQKLISSAAGAPNALVLDNANAQKLLALGLQECPESGILWAESIELEPKAKQTARGVLALKVCDKDPHVILTIAKHLWRDKRKNDKAESWINRAIALDPDFGDAWIYLYKFSLESGTPEKQQEVLRRCEEAEPRHGELWILLSKDINNCNLTSRELLKLSASKIDISLPRYQIIK